MACLTARVRAPRGPGSGRCCDNRQRLQSPAANIPNCQRAVCAPKGPKATAEGQAKRAAISRNAVLAQKYLEYFPTTRQKPLLDVSESQQQVLGWDRRLFSSIMSDLVNSTSSETLHRQISELDLHSARLRRWCFGENPLPAGSLFVQETLAVQGGRGLLPFGTVAGMKLRCAKQLVMLVASCSL